MMIWLLVVPMKASPPVSERIWFSYTPSIPLLADSAKQGAVRARCVCCCNLNLPFSWTAENHSELRPVSSVHLKRVAAFAVRFHVASRLGKVLTTGSASLYLRAFLLCDVLLLDLAGEGLVK